LLSSIRTAAGTVAKTAPVALSAALLAELHQRYKDNSGGEVATSLPELAGADPSLFGISAVTVDGAVHAYGDSNRTFTIQSIAKPFVFGLALEDYGADALAQYIGVEPTGDSFNSVLQPERVSQRRFNPMVNAGALVATGLIKGADPDARFARLRASLRGYLGRDLALDEAALASRQRGDHVNYALAHLLHSQGLLGVDVEAVINLYARQCSLKVDCQDLALMAATLANGGVNPVSGKRAVRSAHVKHILAVMYACGMYEFSGQWAYRVGLPAKCSMSGAILMVVPGQMGVAVFSPPLDKQNKSVRGVMTCEDLSRRLGLHTFRRSLSKSAWTDDSSAELTRALSDAHRRVRSIKAGVCYSCEPEVIKVTPERFAIAAMTVDGRACHVGDADAPFLIQSISKVFAYGLALEHHGREHVLQRVDVEPTGNPYDAIIKLEHVSKRPHNPMVNAGGIATTGLIKGGGRAERLDRILDMYRRYVGHEIYIDMRAYLAEHACGDRNKAISYLLRNFDMIDGDVEQTLDLYLQQCSALIDCRDLATMAATLANGGLNPVTGERAIAADYVGDLLSVMYTCGMYDFAGQWAYTVGLPAKSGVSGAIIAVVPGRMGIAAYSPPLDAHGNSVRGVKALEVLSNALGLNILDAVPAETGSTRQGAPRRIPTQATTGGW
jgi:glutaminase A